MNEIIFNNHQIIQVILIIDYWLLKFNWASFYFGVLGGYRFNVYFDRKEMGEKRKEKKWKCWSEESIWKMNWSLGGGGGDSEYPSKMKMSGRAPLKGCRKKSQRTGVQPCTHPSWIENTLENEGRGETTDTYDERW